MPYVHVKYVREQVNQEQKNLLISGLMDIIVKIMGRNPDLTVIPSMRLTRRIGL